MKCTKMQSNNRISRYLIISLLLIGGWHTASAQEAKGFVADKIIAAAKATGAQAIHPGYGFLSENEAFAKRCEDEGIAFIGPRHFSISAMGDKIESKKLAGAAGVNCIPGYNDAIDTEVSTTQPTLT